MKFQQIAPFLLISALAACATSPAEQVAAAGNTPAQTATAGAQAAQIKAATPPVYPLWERRYQHEGRVVVNVLVLADGSIGGLELGESSGWPALDEAAFRAIETWTFDAATDASGQPIRSRMSAPVRFKLNERDPGGDVSDFIKMKLSFGGYSAYKHISPLLFKTCDGVGIDAAEATRELQAGNQEIDARALRLQTSLADQAPLEYGANPLEYMRQTNQRLAVMYAQSVMDALAKRGESSKHAFCESLAVRLRQSEWTFQNFDKSGYDSFVMLYDKYIE